MCFLLASPCWPSSTAWSSLECSCASRTHQLLAVSLTLFSCVYTWQLGGIRLSEWESKEAVPPLSSLQFGEGKSYGIYESWIYALNKGIWRMQPLLYYPYLIYADNSLVRECKEWLVQVHGKEVCGCGEIWSKEKHTKTIIHLIKHLTGFP